MMKHVQAEKWLEIVFGLQVVAVGVWVCICMTVLEQEVAQEDEAGRCAVANHTSGEW